MNPKKRALDKFSPRDLAEAIVFPVSLTRVQLAEAGEELAAARNKSQLQMTDDERLSLSVLQLKFLSEDQTLLHND